MPKKNFVQIKLPLNQPDSCAECPLIGIVPEYSERPKGSYETRVCLGTMEAMTIRFSKVKASNRDSHHPLRRYCDKLWKAWICLPRQSISIPIEQYNECRRPYEEQFQLKIKFHK